MIYSPEFSEFLARRDWGLEIERRKTEERVARMRSAKGEFAKAALNPRICLAKQLELSKFLRGEV